MAKLGVGIIGCGGIAAVHAAAYRLRSDVEIRALCDVSPTSLRTMGTSLGIEARYQNYHDLLARNDIQAVSICTPHALHYEQFLAAVDAGKHVCIEKPLGLSPTETARMVDAVERAGLVACVGLPLRYYPVNQRLRELVRSGYLGPVVTTKQTMGNNFVAQFFGQPNQPQWWFDLRLSGGGMLITQTVHYLDLLTWLLPSPVVEVLADVWRAPVPVPAGWDSNVVLVLRHADGSRSVIENSWVVDAHPVAVEVYGLEGTIVATGASPAELTITLQSRRPETARLLATPSGAALTRGESLGLSAQPEGHRNLIDDFITSIHAGQPVGELPTIQHGHLLQRLIAAGYRSTQEGRRIALWEVDEAAPTSSAVDERAVR